MVYEQISTSTPISFWFADHCWQINWMTFIFRHKLYHFKFKKIKGIYENKNYEGVIAKQLQRNPILYTVCNFKER